MALWETLKYEGPRGVPLDEKLKWIRENYKGASMEELKELVRQACTLPPKERSP